MSALSLIRKCRAVGIRLQACGERLHVDAPTGVLNAELRQQLAEHKADILALHAIRVRLHTLAEGLGIPRAVVDALPAEELEATATQFAMCEGYMDDNGDPLAHSLLVFYLRQLADKEPTA